MLWLIYIILLSKLEEITFLNVKIKTNKEMHFKLQKMFFFYLIGKLIENIIVLMWTGLLYELPRHINEFRPHNIYNVDVRKISFE